MDGGRGPKQRLSRCQEAFARGLTQGQGLCGAYRAAYRCRGLTDSAVEARAQQLFDTEKIRARCSALCAAGPGTARAPQRTGAKNAGKGAVFTVEADRGESAAAGKPPAAEKKRVESEPRPPGPGAPDGTPGTDAEARGAARVLEELTDIALGRREYPDVDRSGNPVVRPVAMTQRLKALELLGKRYRLFSDSPPPAEEQELEIRLRVVR